jgi:predicted alpha/beta-hydrolase family hydrolase
MHRPIAALALLAALGSAGAEDIVILSTRGGVTQSYLLSSPPPGKARVVAILFPGGAGRVNLESEAGRAVLERGNFLVRTRRLLAGAGVVAAVVDAPSDHAGGMYNSFRKGDAHAADIRAVVADLKKRYGGLPVFLLGTSMGSVSAAHVGQALGNEVNGVALTSSPFHASGPRSKHGDSNLSDFDLAGIKAGLLIVHHSEDACAICPYDEARRRAGDIALITVSGGRPAESGPCEAMSPHGFLGREADTADAIVKWMLKQPYPREIH